MGKWLLQHIFQSLIKEKDTPFFTFLLNILHSRQSRRHTSKELETGRCSISPPTPRFPSCSHCVSTLLPLLTLPLGFTVLSVPLTVLEGRAAPTSLSPTPSASHSLGQGSRGAELGSWCLKGTYPRADNDLDPERQPLGRLLSCCPRRDQVWGTNLPPALETNEPLRESCTFTGIEAAGPWEPGPPRHSRETFLREQHRSVNVLLWVCLRMGV